MFLGLAVFIIFVITLKGVCPTLHPVVSLEQCKSQLDGNISKNEEKVDFKRRRGADFRLGFRWPTFHYLDQTTRQDQWGREKKNSVGLPKPAFFFQSKFKDDHT